MKPPSPPKKMLVFILLMLGTCLCACSSLPFKTADEVLQSRVHGLMNARINGERGKVYEFYSPSYKETVSRDKFLSKNRKIKVLRYEIESIEISPSGDEATVKVKRDIGAMMYEFPGVVSTQKWVKKGWSWYLQVDAESKKSL